MYKDVFFLVYAFDFSQKHLQRHTIYKSKQENHKENKSAYCNHNEGSLVLHPST